MQFQAITHEDLDEVRYLQPADWSDIIPDIRFYIGSAFCYPIMTKLNGHIAGVGATIVFEKTAWLAHIIVDARYRGQGIGSQLVRELLEVPGNHAIESYSLIATELGLPVYAKAGFRKVTEYIFLQRENEWQPSKISPDIVPFREEFRSAVLHMDSDISGENRSTHVSSFLENSWVYIKNREVLGFFIPGLREGAISAYTEEAGLELMKIKFANVDKAALPADNAAGVNFLIQNGFKVTDKKGTRMILGKEIAWKPLKIYSRIGGNLG
jgi:GNAT superfamily N-acetyltransferase